MPYFQTHLACILLMSSAAPPAQWKLFFRCVGWQAYGTCVRDLWLWSAPCPEPGEKPQCFPGILLPLFCFYLWHCFSFFFFDSLCFNPCLSKSVFFFFFSYLETDLLRFAQKLSLVWWIVLEVTQGVSLFPIRSGGWAASRSQGGGWLGWQLLPLWRE